MNAKQEAKLNMFNTVIALCEENLAIVALLLAFQNTYNAFKTTVTAITAAAGQLEQNNSGLSSSKRAAKKELATFGSGIAGFLFAYASSKNDEVLKGEMRISFSDINDAKDEEVGLICQNIYTAANTHIVALADYGLTAPMLLIYQTAITDYLSKAPKPRLSVAEKKAIRAGMKTMFSDGDKLLNEQMDKTAKGFLISNNKLFLDKYSAARIQVEPGTYSTVLKLLVVNSATNMPLRGAKVYRDSTPVAKLSSNKGVVTFKNIEEGNHNFTLKHKLFADKAVTVMMSHNEKKTVTVMITPNP